MSKDEIIPEDALISLTLLENGLDFILKGLEELFGEDESLKNAKAVEIDMRNYKYGFTNLFSGFLLLLKERIKLHIPELIFKGKLSEVRNKLKNSKNLNTVDFDEALDRLEIGPKVAFLKDDLDVIRKIQNFRNEFEHYKLEANKHQLWAEITKFVDIIEKFLQNELGINLEEYSQESKKLHNKAKKIRETVEKLDSKLEERILNILKKLEGKEISGHLLNSDRKIILPTTFKPTKQGYSVKDNRKYTSDFEGEKDSTKWVIEVKGEYVQKGGIPALEILNDIQSSNKLEKWLIVVGKVSDNAKEFAKKNNIFLTDKDSWLEIENI